jgi:hypothetical protein
MDLMEEILDDRIHDEEKSYTSDRSSRMPDERDPWGESEGDVDDEEHADLTGSWIASRIHEDPEVCEECHAESTDSDSIGSRCEYIECYHIHDRSDDEKYDKSYTPEDRLEDRSC